MNIEHSVRSIIYIAPDIKFNLRYEIWLCTKVIVDLKNNEIKTLRSVSDITGSLSYFE